MEPEKIKKHFGLKFILILFGMILIAGIVGLAIIRDRIVNWPQNQVSIVGQGKVDYQPDIANITLGVQIDKTPKAEDALNQMNDKMNKVVAALKANGLVDADIKVQNYSLQSQYDYTNGVASSTGFVANEQVIAKVANIIAQPNKVSQILQQTSAAGANQVLGINFDLSNLQDLKQQARLAAIADAKSKAAALAQTAGVKLGKIVGWYENVIQDPTTDQAAYSSKDAVGGGGSAPSVPNGNQEIIIEVSVNYLVK